MPSVIQLWYNLGSILIPALLIPLLTAFIPGFKLSEKNVFILMTTGFGVGITSFIYGILNEVNGVPNFPFGIQPFFSGMTVSLIGYVVFFIKENKNITHSAEH
jgi:SSS family solute:Na+ symporter